MEIVIIALAPVFAAGLALQQALEWLDPILSRLPGNNTKSYVTSAISVIAGLVLAAGAGLRVLAPLGATVPVWIEISVTGLIVSGGTEGINSILKYLGYAKENQKDQAKDRAAASAVGESAKAQARENVDALHV